jgi:hypothetical protein
MPVPPGWRLARFGRSSSTGWDSFPVLFVSDSAVEAYVSTAPVHGQRSCRRLDYL